MSTQPISYPAAPSLVVPGSRAFSWTGIFAGTFLFLAIEATFGVLGAAVFATVANPNSANPIGPGISIGAGIWMVVLSIIALYFAGKLASRLSGAVTRNMGMYAGLVTFGMSIVATILITALTLGGTALGATGLPAGAVRVADILMYGGYWLFIALVLGMISAASGGTHGAWTSVRITTLDRSEQGDDDFRRAA